MERRKHTEIIFCSVEKEKKKKVLSIYSISQFSKVLH